MTNFNFVGNLKKFLILSSAIFLAIIVAMFTMGVELDIQFRGGSIITYSYEGALNVEDFRKAVTDSVGVDVSAQGSENIATGQQTIVVSLPGDQNLSLDEMTVLMEALHARFADNNIQAIEISNIDPTMGEEFFAKCLVAVGFAFILMLIYIAFRFRKIGGISAGVTAVLALAHDIIVAFGVFVIFGIPINDNFIAVVLTILGFSLNCTVVIYDRIRENEDLLPKGTSIADMTDLSINQTFKRSLIAAIAGLVAMVVVTAVAFVFNVDTIISFSFPLMIGLISGSYSSICLAGPLWVKWQERKQAKEAA